MVDPVDLAFDEHGRLWVVELRDYPGGPPKGTPFRSRVRVLEDADRDGRFEKGRDFAEDLEFACGVQPWDGGALVTAAGRILFLKDADGDGRAEAPKVLFEGFAVENPQLRVNNPTFAMDGWIYAANGLRSQQVKPVTPAGAAPLSIRSADFRFDPIRGRFEAVLGQSQFGMAFDDWGRRFVVYLYSIFSIQKVPEKRRVE